MPEIRKLYPTMLPVGYVSHYGLITNVVDFNPMGWKFSNRTKQAIAPIVAMRMRLDVDCKIVFSHRFKGRKALRLSFQSDTCIAKIRINNGVICRVRHCRAWMVFLEVESIFELQRGREDLTTMVLGMNWLNVDHSEIVYNIYLFYIYFLSGKNLWAPLRLFRREKKFNRGS